MQYGAMTMEDQDMQNIAMAMMHGDDMQHSDDMRYGAMMYGDDMQGGGMRYGGMRMQHGGVNADALMAKLKKAKAKFYGADWCGYCKKQMAEHEGLKQFYKECGKGGCKTSSGEEINGFPTWEINGKAISGYKTLAQLDSMC